MKNVLEALRSRVSVWLASASLEEIGNLPANVIGIPVLGPPATPSQEEKKSEAKVSVRVPVTEKKRRRTIPKRAQFRMDQDQVNLVREVMKDYELNSPAYNKKRDELCREHGFCRRQVSSAVTGVERAAKRKPRVATEKVAPKPKSARKTSRKK